MSGTRLWMSTRPASSGVCAGESCGCGAGVVVAQAQTIIATEATTASRDAALLTLSAAFKGEGLVVGTEAGIGVDHGHCQRGRYVRVGKVQPALVEALAVPLDQQALAERHH